MPKVATLNIQQAKNYLIWANSDISHISRIIFSKNKFTFKAKECQSEKSPIFDSQKSTKTTTPKNVSQKGSWSLTDVLQHPLVDDLLRSGIHFVKDNQVLEVKWLDINNRYSPGSVVTPIETNLTLETHGPSCCYPPRSCLPSRGSPRHSAGYPARTFRPPPASSRPPEMLGLWR